MPGLMITEVPSALIYVFCFVLFCLSYLGNPEVQLILVHHRKPLSVRDCGRQVVVPEIERLPRLNFKRQKIVVVKSTTLTIYYLSDLRQAI